MEPWHLFWEPSERGRFCELLSVESCGQPSGDTCSSCPGPGSTLPCAAAAPNSSCIPLLQVLLCPAAAGDAAQGICHHHRHWQQHHLHPLLKVPALWDAHGEPEAVCARRCQQHMQQQVLRHLLNPSQLKACWQATAAVHPATCTLYCVQALVPLLTCSQATPFDPAKSSTARWLGCSDKQCQCGSPSCSCRQDKCYYTRHYGEVLQQQQLQPCML